MKSLSLLIGIAAIFVCLGNVCAQQENLVLYYNFDEGKGDVVKDLSKCGNNGKIVNANWVADGKSGGGMEFDGKTSLIEVPHNESLDPGKDQVTVMAWLKPLSIPSGFAPIARKGSVAESGWGLDIGSNTQTRGWMYPTPGNPIIAIGKSPELKNWNHLAMVYDGKEIRLYLNGAVDASIKASGNINKNKGSLWIGKKADEAVFLQGTMDDLAIFNIAISEADVKRFMEGGVKVAVDASSKLATSWGEIKSR